MCRRAGEGDPAGVLDEIAVAGLDAAAGIGTAVSGRVAGQDGVAQVGRAAQHVVAAAVIGGVAGHGATAQDRSGSLVINAAPEVEAALQRVSGNRAVGQDEKLVRVTAIVEKAAALARAGATAAGDAPGHVLAHGTPLCACRSVVEEPAAVALPARARGAQARDVSRLAARRVATADRAIAERHVAYRAVNAPAQAVAAVTGAAIHGCPSGAPCSVVAAHLRVAYVKCGDVADAAAVAFSSLARTAG